MADLFILFAIVLVIVWIVYAISNTGDRHQQAPSFEKQPTAYTTKAQSETALKDQIQNLPELELNG